MNINKLHLHSFGPFENKTIDFSSANSGLHIIYGPNEAGKSSSLRALTDLLFGFQHKSEDGWLFGNKNLAVSADLQLPDDNILKVTRYKRRNNDLIDNISGEPITQHYLKGFLGQMERDSFLHTFGITHDSLRLGVESILAAGGDLGHALFAATSGLNTLKQLISNLDVKQNELFSPRAQKATINAGIKSIKELRKKQKEVTINHNEWQLLQDQLQETQNEEKQNNTEFEEIAELLINKSRHVEGLKYLGRFDELTSQLDFYKDLPHLDETFREERITTQTHLKETKQSLVIISGQLAESKQKLASYNIDDKILSNAKLIEILESEAHVTRKAMVDAKSIHARAVSLESSCSDSLLKLRKGLTLENINSFLLTQSDQLILQELNTEGIKIEEGLRTVKQTCKKNDDKLISLQDQLNPAVLKTDTSELSLLVQQCLENIHLETQLETDLTELATIQRQSNQRLSALPLFDGSLEELCSLKTPSIESIRVFQETFNSIDQEITNITKTINDQKRKLDQKKNNLLILAQASDIVTKEDLHKQRELRDHGWKMVCQNWLEGKAIDTTLLKDFPHSETLKDAFETSILQADQTADQLLLHADKVAAIEICKAEIDAITTNINKLSDEYQTYSKRRIAADKDWLSIWESTLIIPRSPVEMIAWRDEASELKRLSETLFLTQDRCTTLQNKLKCLKENLREVMIKAGLTVASQTHLKLLTDQSRQFLEDQNRQLTRQAQIQETIKGLQKEQHYQTAYQTELEHKKSKWKQEWEKSIEKLGFSGATKYKEVQTFLTSLQDIYKKIEETKALRIRESAIYKDYKNFSEKVARLTTVIAQDLTALPAEEAALQLHAQLRVNSERKKEVTYLQNQIQKLTSELTELQKRNASLQEKIVILCNQATVNSVEEISKIEQEVAKKQNIQHELQTLLARISEISGGKEATLFFEEIRSINPDELQVDVEQLTQKKEHYKTQQRAIVEKLTIINEQIKNFSSGSEALKYAEQAESKILSLEAEVQRYITLKVASVILIKSVERYRKHNQNPILELASSYFKTITNGSFSAIRADFDDKGDPVLKAERQDKQRFSIGELSDGSKDQLFLSLRLGSLAQHISKNGAMPFIVDDILVHFDDERSKAALKALYDLSKQSQVIFFTHHEHLIEIAQEALPSENLRIHTL